MKLRDPPRTVALIAICVLRVAPEDKAILEGPLKALFSGRWGPYKSRDFVTAAELRDLVP